VLKNDDYKIQDVMFKKWIQTFLLKWGAPEQRIGILDLISAESLKNIACHHCPFLFLASRKSSM
jgi:hypothetical protein